MRRGLSLAAAVALTSGVLFAANEYSVTFNNKTWQLVGVPGFYVSGAGTVTDIYSDSMDRNLSVSVQNVGDLDNNNTTTQYGNNSMEYVGVRLLNPTVIDSFVLAFNDSNLSTPPDARQMTITYNGISVAEVTYDVRYVGTKFNLELNGTRLGGDGAVTDIKQFIFSNSGGTVSFTDAVTDVSTQRGAAHLDFDVNGSNSNFETFNNDDNLTIWTYSPSTVWQRYFYNPLLDATTAAAVIDSEFSNNSNKMKQGKAYWIKTEDNTERNDTTLTLSEGNLNLATNVSMEADGWNLVALPTTNIMNGHSGALVYCDASQVDENITAITDIFGQTINIGTAGLNVSDVNLSTINGLFNPGSSSSTIKLRAYPAYIGGVSASTTADGNGSLFVSDQPFKITSSCNVYTLSGTPLYTTAGTSATTNITPTGETSIAIHINTESLEKAKHVGQITLQIPGITTTPIDINLTNTTQTQTDFNASDIAPVVSNRIISALQSTLTTFAATDVNVTAFDIRGTTATDGEELLITFKSPSQSTALSNKYNRFGISENTMTLVYDTNLTGSLTEAEIREFNTTSKAHEAISTAVTLSAVQASNSVVLDPRAFGDINLTTSSEGNYTYLYTNIYADIYETESDNNLTSTLFAGTSKTVSGTLVEVNTTFAKGFVGAVYQVGNLLATTPTATTADLKNNFVWAAGVPSSGLTYDLVSVKNAKPLTIYTYKDYKWFNITLTGVQTEWASKYDLFATRPTFGYWVKTRAWNAGTDAFTVTVPTTTNINPFVVTHFDNNASKSYNDIYVEQAFAPNTASATVKAAYVEVDGTPMAGGYSNDSYVLKVDPFNFNSFKDDGTPNLASTVTVKDGFSSASANIALSYTKPTAPTLAFSDMNISGISSSTYVYETFINESDLNDNNITNRFSGGFIAPNDLNATTALRAVNRTLISGGNGYIYSDIASVNYVPVFGQRWEDFAVEDNVTFKISKNDGSGELDYYYLVNFIKSASTTTKSATATKYATNSATAGTTIYKMDSNDTKFSTADTTTTNGVQLKTATACGTATLAYKPVALYGNAGVTTDFISVRDSAGSELAFIDFDTRYSQEGRSWYLHCSANNNIYSGDFNSTNGTGTTPTQHVYVTTPKATNTTQTFPAN